MKHGLSKTRIYRIYYGIHTRCTKDTHKYYNKYGGRGIKNLWNGFEEFYEDMKDGYQDHLTIDRRDNDGHYCKSNCRWATRKEQSRNLTINRMIGNKCMSEWSEELGINLSTLSQRRRRGLSIEDILNPEVQRQTKYIYQGKKLKDWCIELGFKYEKIRSRIRRGQSIKEALEL